MKKFLYITFIMMIVPIAASAQWGAGAAMFLKSPVLLGQTINVTNYNCNQFSFGGDARFKYDWLQAEGLLLYSIGEINSIDVYLDVGVSLDVGIFQILIGVGPNFSNNLGQNYLFQTGLNARIGAELYIKPVSCGISYIMAANFSNGIHVATGSGMLGAYVLFWL